MKSQNIPEYTGKPKIPESTIPQLILKSSLSKIIHPKNRRNYDKYLNSEKSQENPTSSERNLKTQNSW